MAQIELDLSHSYVPHPQADEDYALLPLKFTFRDGGAYALLGPSGCGKTTLLNCVSGLLRPSHGRILFDGQDVTAKTPQARNIAQVFQFPVVYDTMTVAENLAFPLRNRGIAPDRIRERVGRIAEMLEMSQVLDRRASGLTADAKQKISLGRGLVRSDVSAVLFDEPLTVIDPQLKWELRRKLKEIHREFKLTLIYVTHDQTEALTFADQVMVMARGRAVQVGGADDLFERPAHTFVGHFIGSPGMNFLPAQWTDGALRVGACQLDGLDAAQAARLADAGPAGRAARVPAAGGAGRAGRAAGAGGTAARRRHLPVADGGLRRQCRARPPEQPGAGARAGRDGLAVGAQYAYLLLPRRGADPMKPINHRAWFLVLPVVLCVAFSAILPLMTIVNYSVQDIISPERRVFVGTEWFAAVLQDEELHGALLRQIGFSLAVLAIEIPLGILLALSMPASGWRASAVLVVIALSLLIPGTWSAPSGRCSAAPTSACSARRCPGWGGLQLHRQRRGRLGHGAGHGRVALDAAGRAAVLCGVARDSRCLLPGRPHRRRLAPGGVPVHPAAQDARRPDDRGAVALHGQLHDLYRALRAHRRRPGNATTFLSQYLTQKAVGQFDLGPAAAFSIIYFLIILLLCFILYNWMQRAGTTGGMDEERANA